MKTLITSMLAGSFLLANMAMAERQTMYVDAGNVYTAAGERFVMRGFNEMFVWSDDPSGAQLVPEIDQSGANALRLVWDHKVGKVETLIELIERTIDHKMVAIPECHNATGKWGEALQECVDFWNQSALIKAVQKNKRWAIVNIANEAGDHSITDEQFTEFYQKAISSLRDWGYTVPIMIDAAGWGQNVDQLLRVAPALLAHDPLHNVIFSTHSYWAEDVAMANYRKVAVDAPQQGIAMIIGEGPSVTRVGQCDDPKPLPYLAGMQLLEERASGWLNWSWGGMQNGDCDDFLYFDITKHGEFGQWWHTPGADIVALSEYGVMQTSERPSSFYPNGEVQASGLYLHVEKEEMSVGDESRFQVIVAPANAHNQATQLMVSGCTSCVAIDRERGVIRALQPGQVTLQAKHSPAELEWSAQITVSQ